MADVMDGYHYPRDVLPENEPPPPPLTKSMENAAFAARGRFRRPASVRHGDGVEVR